MFVVCLWEDLYVSLILAVNKDLVCHVLLQMRPIQVQSFDTVIDMLISVLTHRFIFVASHRIYKVNTHKI